ncbi:MAG: hypothetical protein C0183_21925 [Roseiflexus castenholzii]|uniref:glycosyltransferase family 2 protein n=1 Tax=Roseiflexus castenholzii TaxID=120962 RepID=UPI000CCB92FF|nr:MAG: hypothetical protein C0183_21925 [Roseiflexus castenholzii]
MTEPRVSVVITAYNAAEYLSAAIESVLAQSHPADDVVVVDDGSTDASAAVAQSYAHRGVRLIRQDNQGPGAARNRGIRETSGELVAFLDGDDLWLPNKLERQLVCLVAHPETVMVSCLRWRWDQTTGERHIEYFGVPPGRILAHENVVRNVIGNPSMTLIRRSVFDAVGMFDTQLRWGQDWDLFIRIASYGPVGFVEEPLMIYRWHPGGISHHRGIERLDMFQSIACRGIARIQPAWRRPLLLARRLSWDQCDRAAYASQVGLSRARRVWHAALGLALFPFERPVSKTKRLLRSIFGDDSYAAVGRRLRSVVYRPISEREGLERF